MLAWPLLKNQAEQRLSFQRYRPELIQEKYISRIESEAKYGGEKSQSTGAEVAVTLLRSPKRLIRDYNSSPNLGCRLLLSSNSICSFLYILKFLRLSVEHLIRTFSTGNTKHTSSMFGLDCEFWVLTK